jgi:hypothetical protein
MAMPRDAGDACPAPEQATPPLIDSLPEGLDSLQQRYPSAPAQAVQDKASELARSAARELMAEVPSSLHPALEEELLLQLSYLADALGTGQAELFARHVGWYEGFWPQRKLGPLSFARLLAALETAASATLPEHHEIKAVCAAARTAKERSS